MSYVENTPTLRFSVCPCVCDLASTTEPVVGFVLTFLTELLSGTLSRKCEFCKTRLGNHHSLRKCLSKYFFISYISLPTWIEIGKGVFMKFNYTLLSFVKIGEVKTFGV